MLALNLYRNPSQNTVFFAKKYRVHLIWFSYHFVIIDSIKPESPPGKGEGLPTRALYNELTGRDRTQDQKTRMSGYLVFLCYYSFFPVILVFTINSLILRKKIVDSTF